MCIIRNIVSFKLSQAKNTEYHHFYLGEMLLSATVDFLI